MLGEGEVEPSARATAHHDRRPRRRTGPDYDADRVREARRRDSNVREAGAGQAGAAYDQAGSTEGLDTAWAPCDFIRRREGIGRLRAGP